MVGLLAGPGAVWQLEFGDFVLLQPERINGYAAAVMRKVRAHPDELGSIPEADVLDGKLDYQDMQRLSRDEEQIVLRAMHQTLLRAELLRAQIAWAISHAEKNGYAKELYLNLDDSLGEKDKATSQINVMLTDFAVV